jgi:uncharacterized membrane protein
MNVQRRYRRGFALVALGIAMAPWVSGLLTRDHRIDSLAVFVALLFVSAACLLAGLHLLLGWIERVSFGRPVTPRRAATVILLAAVVAAGTYWRVATFREAHTHMHVVAAGSDAITPEQQQWAEDFHRRSLDAALKNGWFDFKTAMANGFQVDRVNRTHYPSLRNMFDGVILDPERPEWLIYNDTPDGGKVLVGFMFFTNKLEDVGPTPAGALAQWHFHPYPRPRCAVEGIWTVSRPDENGRCAEGVPVNRTPEMFHVWFIDHPLGRFSEMNLVPEYWQDDEFNLGALHPISVHFAIALFVIAVLLDVVGLIARKREYQRAAWINLAIAAFATVAAITLGFSAELALRPTHAMHQMLDVHKQLAFASLGAVLLLAAWRYALHGNLPRNTAALVLYVGISLAAVGAMTGAGYYGGEMVYGQGAGVRAMDQFIRSNYWRQVDTLYRKRTDAVENVSAEPPPAGHHH